MRLPKYRHHKPRNLAFVEIDGKRFYLGRYDSPESRSEYQRILNELYLKRQNKLQLRCSRLTRRKFNLPSNAAISLPPGEALATATYDPIPSCAFGELRERNVLQQVRVFVRLAGRLAQLGQKRLRSVLGCREQSKNLVGLDPAPYLSAAFLLGDHAGGTKHFEVSTGSSNAFTQLRSQFSNAPFSLRKEV